ncbi:uncharacterized protein DUF2796 [Tamilnaduibacter salinus]|uniref:Uncharacterized protein DUF2796 n=1 Tax=Tamilnaduibacter salinus TaxID=1484056 RepID=A0A2U1CY99_9GAMM|nr:DUF2796 domain-containing protein [Tamilnaduibacter salinus]PVY77350.1 uncharacterized protein DUF2796 [Tamilnaduibacter salinus]
MSTRNRSGAHLALMLGLLTTSAAFAAAASNPGAHEHGKARLEVAIEGRTAIIRFESPAMNLVGFEHDPRTPEQRQAITDATGHLEHHALLDRSGDTCAITDSRVERLAGRADPETHQADHGDHGDHGEQDHHEAHSHHDDDDHAEASSHSEFHVMQTLACDEPLAGQTLTTGLFTEFAGIEVIEAAWVSGSGQGGASLTTDRPTLTLSR